MPTINHQSPVSGDESASLELTCSASQYVGVTNGMKIKWYRQESGSESAIASSSNILISTNHDGSGTFTETLKFKSLKRSDAGSIKCRAQNDYGFSPYSLIITLNVKCQFNNNFYSYKFVG